MKRKIALLFLFLLPALALPGFRAGRADSVRGITILVYMCGSNLESLYGSATADLEEMTRAGINDQEVSLLVMMGGSSSASWAGESGSQETVICEIGRRGRRILERCGRRNMGDPQTLSDFLIYGTENRPADQYAVILWDHGGGPLEGVCWDELFGSDHLTLDEVTEALNQSPFAEKKLSWIGFDACLMSTLEIAAKVAPYAEYMIASQAEEPAGGWDYRFLRDLHQNQDGAESGRIIIDTYFESPQENAPDLTLACTDLSKIQEIERLVNSFYLDIAQALSVRNFSSFAHLRFEATGFGKSAEAWQGTDGYDLVDLVSLTSGYASLYPDEAEEIDRAVETAVVYHRENLADCSGLSVYHPFRNREKFSGSWGSLYSHLTESSGYAAYVDAYGKIMTGEQLVRWNHLDQIFWDLEAGQVSCALSRDQAEHLASARLVILAQNIHDGADESFFRVYTSADVSVEPETEDDCWLRAEYHRETLQALDPETLYPMTGAISYRVSDEGTYYVNLYPRTADGILAETPVVGEYRADPETGEIKLKSYAVYDEMTQTWSHRGSVRMDQYTDIQFVNEYRTPETNQLGEVAAFDRWPEDLHTDTHQAAGYALGQTGFRLSFSAGSARSDLLFAAFELTDTQGNTFMTERVYLTDYSSQFYRGLDAYLPDDTVLQEGTVVITPEEVYFMLLLENKSDADEQYTLTELSINGVPAEKDRLEILFLNWSDPEKEEKIISPGEIGWMIVPFDRRELEEADPTQMIRIVSGTYMVVSREKSTEVYTFTAEAEIPIQLKEGEERRSEELNMKRPAAPGGTLSWTQNAYLSYELGIGEKPSSFITLSVQMTNRSDEDLTFGMEVLSLNGKPVNGKRVLSSNGGGRPVSPDQLYEDSYGNQQQLFSLRRGERRAVSVKLNAEDVMKVAPDVLLRECVCRMFVYEVNDAGEFKVIDYFPLRIEMEIPLSLFYVDAGSLPMPEIVDGFETNPENFRKLFSCEDLTLSVNTVLFGDDQLLMLLYAENLSEEDCAIQLNHAKFNQTPAKIGRQISDFLFIRNLQKSHHGMDEDLWPEIPFAYKTLKAGEKAYWYVSVFPDKPENTREGILTFDALIVRAGEKMFQTQMELSFSEEAKTEINSTEPVLIPTDQQLLNEKVRTIQPEKAVPRLLTRSSRENESPMTSAGYVIFRKIESEKKLVEMNIIDHLDQTEETVWYIPAAFGEMQISEDGKTATSVYPGLQMTARSGEESFAISATQSWMDDQGVIWIYAHMDSLFFLSQYDMMDQMLSRMRVGWNPETGETILYACRGREQTNAEWASMMLHKLYSLRGEPGGRDILQFMSDYFDNENMSEKDSLMQILQVENDQIQLAMEPLQNPEECWVFLFWTMENGKTKTANLVPLTQFSAME